MRGGTSAFRVALQALQVGADIGGALVAQIAIFLEQLVEDADTDRRLHMQIFGLVPFPEYSHLYLLSNPIHLLAYSCGFIDCGRSRIAP